jgi:type IX secretion system PorP/SprF family membrane protein
LSGGIGVHVMNDHATDILSTNSAGLSYAYRLNISRTVSVSAALDASIVQKKINWNNLTFGDMIDPRLGIVYHSQEKRPGETKNFLDVCAGVLAYSKSVYGGLALSHLTQPDESFIASGTSRLPLKVTVHAGAVIPFGEKITRFNEEEKSTTVSPNILLLKQGKFNQFNVGSYFQHSAFVCGLWFRGNLNENKHISPESFITLVGIQKGVFKLGYSYDFTLNKLKSSTGGTHEISAGLQFASRTAGKKRFKAVHCPTF